MTQCTIVQTSLFLSTHADRQGVDYWLLLVSLFVYTVTDFSGEDKASGVKLCTVVHGRPGQGMSYFGKLCSSRSPKSDDSAIYLENGKKSSGWEELP